MAPPPPPPKQRRILATKQNSSSKDDLTSASRSLVLQFDDFMRRNQVKDKRTSWTIPGLLHDKLQFTRR